MVLVAPRNPLNIGAAARAMSNFGCFDLRLVNAYEVAFQEARSAVGAAGLLASAKQFPDVAEAIADCSLVVGTTAGTNRELQHELRRLEAASKLIRKHAGKTAILFGSEKFGLSTEDMSYCHWLTRIPSRDEHGSMNLGQAVAVTLYEMIRETRAVAAKPMARKPAEAAELDRFMNLLLEALDVSGFVNERTAVSTREKLRRMIRRMDLPKSDAVLWQGMIRQILWKLKRE